MSTSPTTPALVLDQKIRPHTEPELGDHFIRHLPGNVTEKALCVGKKTFRDQEGNVTAWLCVVSSGFTSPASIHSTTTWTAASWHSVKDDESAFRPKAEAKK